MNKSECVFVCFYTLHDLSIGSVKILSANWINAIAPTIVHIIPVNRPMYEDGKLFYKSNLFEYFLEKLTMSK